MLLVAQANINSCTINITNLIERIKKTSNTAQKRFLEQRITYYKEVSRLYTSFIDGESPDIVQFIGKYASKQSFLIDVMGAFSDMLIWKDTDLLPLNKKLKISKQLASYLNRTLLELRKSKDIRNLADNIFRLEINSNIVAIRREKFSLNYSTPIEEVCIKSDLEKILIKLSESLENPEKELSDNNLLKKLQDRNAHIHYVSKRLKEIFVKHGIPKREHNTSISDLIVALVSSKYEEGALRKLLKNM